MSDPVINAVASAVASHSVATIKSLIEDSEQPEDVWEESLYEIAIKIRTSYLQNVDAPGHNGKQFERDLRGYGEMTRELTVRAEKREFDQENIELAESVADSCAEICFSYSVGDDSMETLYTKTGLNENVETVIESHHV